MVLSRPTTRRAPRTSGREARPLRAAWPALAVLTAFAALLAALEIGGPLAGVAGPDLVLQIGRPAAELVLTLAASACLGSLVVAVWASRPGAPAWGRLLDTAAAAAAVWTVAAAVGLFLFYLDNGPPVRSASFGPTLIFFLTGLEAGRVQVASVIAAALLTTLIITVRSHTGAALLVVAAIAATGPIALAGHASNAPGDHATAVVALGLHIAGAGVWLGGLGVLAVLGSRLRGAPLADLAARYSGIALVCFVVVGLSGVVSAAIRLGGWSGLATAYGALVVVKSATLVAAGALGAVHRRVTIPRIATGSGRLPFLRLVGVELLVLGVATGFAAALTATAPPELPVLPLTTPAEVLTGAPLPPPMSVVSVLTEWRFDPLWLLVGLLLAGAYVVGVLRLRRRGEAWPVGRTVSWLVGVVVLVWLTNGGLNRYQEVLFSAHMLARTAVTVLVPVLLVPAAPVTLALRAVPERRDGTRGGREWLLLAVRSPVAAVLTNPVVAAVLLAGSLVGFTWSPLFSWASTDHFGHEWATAQLLLAGSLLVLSTIGPDPVPHRFPLAIRLLVLLAVTAFHAVFGLALILGTGLLLPDWYGAMGWGTSALADQQAGGGIVWGVGAIPTLALAVLVAVDRVRRDGRETCRSDRPADRPGDVDPAVSDGVLAPLGRGRA